MKIVSTVKLLLLVGTLFTGLNAQQAVHIPCQQAPFTMPFDVSPVDMEMFNLVKSELESTRNVLQDIHNSQNPALIRAAASSLGGLIKELAYIGASLVIGSSGILGFGRSIGLDIDQALRDPLGQGMLLMTLPAVIISVIVSYVSLKIVFNRILATPEKDAHHIKESLAEIKQTINKLSYETKKLEYAMQLAKQQKLA